MTEDNLNQKKIWRLFGIFLAIILILGSSLFGIVKVSRKFWNEGLKTAVSDILREKKSDVWIIGNVIPLNSPFATSANLYELRNKDSAEKYFAIIIRIPTIYGHIPAVFTYSKNKGAEFIGYSNVKGRVKVLLEQNSSDVSITYWIDRVPEIVEKAEEGGRK